MIDLKVKLFKECKKLELIRMKVGETSEWAIVGEQRNGKAPVLILTKDAYCMDTSDRIGDSRRPEASVLSGIMPEASVLSYGTGFHAEPLHERECDVASGPRFERPRSLIIAGDNRLISFVWKDGAQKGASGFFDLSSGSPWVVPGLYRAAFSDWTVWPKGSDRGVVVFS